MLVSKATIFQTRDRLPEAPLAEAQILVYRMPIPEPLRFLEPRETETRKIHELEEYGLMHAKVYQTRRAAGFVGVAGAAAP